MMNISILSFNDSANITASIPYSRTIIFSILITFGIPSIICSIFLFIQFIHRPKLRRQPINLLIFCLVIVTFIQKILEMPLTLIFLYQNYVVHQSYWFCQLWNILQYSFGTSIIWITMISSIERYLFVFHSAFLKRHFILLRIIPLICSLFCPLMMQVILIVLAPPCITSFRYNAFMCAFPCYVFLEFWSIFGWNVYVGIPVFVIIISNSILVGRVLKHKQRLQQSRVWSKVVKLIIQVISIALLDMIAWIPIYIAAEMGRPAPRSSPSSTKAVIFMEYLVYLPYLVVHMCPFICLIGLPALHKSLKEMMYYCFRWSRIRTLLTTPTVPHRICHETDMNR